MGAQQEADPQQQVRPTQTQEVRGGHALIGDESCSQRGSGDEGCVVDHVVDDEDTSLEGVGDVGLTDGVGARLDRLGEQADEERRNEQGESIDDRPGEHLHHGGGDHETGQGTSHTDAVHQGGHECRRQHDPRSHDDTPHHHVAHRPVDVGLGVQQITVAEDHCHRVHPEQHPLDADERQPSTYRGQLGAVTEPLQGRAQHVGGTLAAIDAGRSELPTVESHAQTHRECEERRRDDEDDGVGMMHRHVSAGDQAHGSRDDGTQHEPQRPDDRHDRRGRQIFALVNGVFQSGGECREQETVHAHRHQQQDEQGDVGGLVACAVPHQYAQHQGDEATQTVRSHEDALP